MANAEGDRSRRRGGASFIGAISLPTRKVSKPLTAEEIEERDKKVNKALVYFFFLFHFLWSFIKT